MPSKPKEAIVEAKAELVLAKERDYHSLQYTSKDIGLIMSDFKSRYGIEPKRGHLAVYEKGGYMMPYIQKSGYCAIANAAKISTTVEVQQIHREKGFAYVQVKCRAILPNGVSHEGIGYSDITEPGRNTINKCLSMATTHARSKAIAAAMEIQETPYDEFNESDEIKQRSMDVADIINEVLSLCPSCAEKGWSKIQKKCVKCNITFEEILEAKAKEAELQ